MKTYDTSLEGIERLAVSSMVPSNREVNYSISASGDYFVAPDHGYVQVNCYRDNVAAHSYLLITSGGYGTDTSYPSGSNHAIHCFFIVKKGNDVQVLFENCKNITCRFIYAEGVLV